MLHSKSGSLFREDSYKTEQSYQTARHLNYYTTHITTSIQRYWDYLTL